MRPRLPNIALQTHEGRRVRFYDDLVRGRVVLINFIYTKCTGI
jgi:protein SCO1/2